MLTWLKVTTSSKYVFRMYVDNAARLWLDNQMILDATCETPRNL